MPIRRCEVKPATRLSVQNPFERNLRLVAGIGCEVAVRQRALYGYGFVTEIERADATQDDPDGIEKRGSPTGSVLLSLGFPAAYPMPP